MADFRVDQAAGLRRLFGQAQLQVVTFAAGSSGLGRSLTVANLAAALHRLGKEVLVIDENHSNNDVAAAFGLRGGLDLIDALNGRGRLVDVLVQPLAGLHILPAAKAVQKLGVLSRPQQHALLSGMQQLERPLDVILVDASMRHPAGFSPLGLASHETVIMVSANGSSITDAYALIKKVSQTFARKHFRIMVGRAKTPREAYGVFENIAEVAQRRGIATLEYAGAVPNDEAMRQSRLLGRPVVQVAPETASAVALREIAGDLLRWRQGQGLGGDVQQFLQQLLHLSQRITPPVLRVG